MYYIISIFHSISVNKVKSVSKNPKGNKCDKGHSWKPFYIIVIIHFLIISSNIFKIPYLQKNTTKHADKIKEYNTIFIVSLKKFVLFSDCAIYIIACTVHIYVFVFSFLSFFALFSFFKCECIILKHYIQDEHG